MMLNLSPLSVHMNESLCSLRFATKVLPSPYYSFPNHSNFLPGEQYQYWNRKEIYQGFFVTLPFPLLFPFTLVALSCFRCFFFLVSRTLSDPPISFSLESSKSMFLLFLRLVSLRSHQPCTWCVCWLLLYYVCLLRIPLSALITLQLRRKLLELNCVGNNGSHGRATVTLWFGALTWFVKWMSSRTPS